MIDEILLVYCTGMDFGMNGNKFSTLLELIL